MITLDMMQPKQKCMVVKLNTRGPFRKRLMEMGIVKGTVLEVEKVAPLGDPVDVKVKGYHLSLRKKEAKGIVVEEIN